MPEYTDMLGRAVVVPAIPQRIVSLVPSQTELIVDLGAGDRLAGVTKFCIHPSEVRKKALVVGGTKSIHQDRIKGLSPDLIIANKEENAPEWLLPLAETYPVWISDIQTWTDALTMIRSVGEIIGSSDAAHTLITEIRRKFQILSQQIPPTRPRVLYLIWRDPWMAAGSDTFIHSMLEKAGFQNVLSRQSRYPEITASTIQQLEPDMIFLSSEPFPFSSKHIQEVRSLGFQGDIHLVDGEMFSWYGSRLLQAPPYFSSLWSNVLDKTG